MQLINVHCTMYLFLVTQNLERKADIISYSAVFDRLLIVKKRSYFINTSWRHLHSCPSGIFNMNDVVAVQSCLSTHCYLMIWIR